MLKTFFIQFAEIASPIFYKLFYMSIRATFVGLVIYCLLKIFRKTIYPKVRYILWFCFIFMLIVPVEIENKYNIYSYLPINMQSIKEIPYSKMAKLTEETALENTVPETIVEKSFNTQNLENVNTNNKIEIKELILDYIIPVAWSSFFLIMCVLYIIFYERFNKKIKNNHIIDVNVVNILEKCKRKLNIKAKIYLLYQDLTRVPAIFGIVNNKILFSDNIKDLSDEEIEYIIMHELYHYKRKDNLFNIIIIVLKYLYIFNPIIVILLDKMKKEMEYAVDEAVTKELEMDYKKNYCRTLVKLAVNDNKLFFSKGLTLSNNKKELEKRIIFIKSPFKIRKFRNIIILLTASIITFLIIVFCSTENKLKLEEIEAILNSTKIESNYIINIDILNFPGENRNYQIFSKDNIKILDNNTENTIIEIDNKKRYLLIDSLFYTIDSKDNIMDSYNCENLMELVKNKEYNYTFLRNEVYKDKKCAVFSIYAKYKYYVRIYDFWMDLNNGNILKKETYINSKSNLKPDKPTSVTEYTYEYNVVTDEDIAKYIDMINQIEFEEYNFDNNDCTI